MGKPVVGLNSELLIWAREQAGQSVEEVALCFKKDPQIVEAWESGDSAPTYVQLEKLAYVVYKRPIAIFFFPEPPDEPDPKGSFRTLPDFEVENLSADTRFKIRKARSFQLSLAELNDEINPSERQLFREISVRPHSDVVRVVGEVRKYLGIQLEDQSSWKSIRNAMENWRAAIEDVGIYVFKDSFKQKDISGFCLLSEEFPIIYVNNGTSFSRQIFTLFHELGHILVQTNGITKEDDSFIESLEGTSRVTEVFCNRFANEFLVPSSDLDQHLPLKFYDDETIRSLAVRYLVSREVVLRNLLDRQLITSGFYRTKVKEWDEYRRRGKGKSGGDYYATQATYLGKRYLELAFAGYYSGRCSIEQLADHLNVKVKSVAGLESIGLQ